jgi:hypothetical protein
MPQFCGKIKNFWKLPQKVWQNIFFLQIATTFFSIEKKIVRNKTNIFFSIEKKFSIEKFCNFTPK